MVTKTEEEQVNRLESQVENGGGGAWEYLCLVRKLKLRRSDKVLKFGLSILNDPKKRSALGPEEWTLYEEVAVAAMDCQCLDVAKEYIKVLQKKFPGSKRVGRLEAMLLEAKGLWAEAENAYSSLLEDSPLDQFPPSKRVGKSMSAEASDVGEDNVVSVPRGGPIYIPDMVSPLTRVPDFELSVFNELQNLKAEIGWDSLETCDYDISVDELKIVKEEELVEKAFEEAFKDGELTANDPQVPEKQPSQGETDKSNTSVSKHTSGDRENREPNENTSDKRKKRRRVNQKNGALEESYVTKVQQLARIKQKQDEDKKAARLHSFNGSCSIIVCASSSSERTDRMRSLKSTSSSAKVRSSNAHEHVAVHFPEVILCFEVYHSRKAGVKTQEFLVLGRQFLTEVRDKIYCLTDEIMKKADRYDPSGYFLIEDVFCNDTREASAIDYSKPILEWLENSRNDALEKWECIVSGEMQQKQKALLDNATELQLPRFKSVDMQKTRFCDLRFRLGAGYIYCHQGDCKHLIVIRDMRLIHPEDVQNRAAYPLNTFQSKLRFRKCSVCKIYKAEKVTVDDKWAAENPCYFCNLCYYMLHYVNGSLLYNDFSVYDYYHE